jgi:hypothetical protein
MKQVKLILALLIGLGVCSTTIAFAQETTTQEQVTTTEDVYQPDEQVSDFDVKTAYDTMQSLQSSVDEITQQLYDLDAKEAS